MHRAPAYQHKAIHPVWGKKAGPAGVQFKAGGQLLTIDGRPVAAAPIRRASTVELKAQTKAIVDRARAVAEGKVRFRRLGNDEIRKDVHDTAQRMLWRCANALGLKNTPSINWYATVDELDLEDERHGTDIKAFYDIATRGRCNPPRYGITVIDLKGTANLRELVEVIAHEARHAWQFEHWGTPDGDDDPRWQADANEYGRQVLAWWDANGGKL